MLRAGILTASEGDAESGFGLVQVLQRRAREHPHRRALVFLEDGESKEVRRSFAELDAGARAVATLLQRDTAEGDRALLLYPHGLEFIEAFLGCLYAGVVAVPTPPPRLNRPMPRTQSVAVDSKPAVVLTTTQLYRRYDDLVRQAPELGATPWVATDERPAAGRWREPEIEGGTLAFLQYTSGSTAAPKGVMVTHGNLLENETLIQEELDSTPESRLVSWLPLYHDMGLITTLQGIFVGFETVLLSPASFFQRPVRWLAAISRFQADLSGGPNFAYDLCVRRIGPEERRQLDLSRWRFAFSGAELIRPGTLGRFAEAFAPSGFRRQAFRPAYGLAESTLLVSCSDTPALRVVARDGQEPVERVGCGRVSHGYEVRIVEPETRLPCPDGTEGEIWLSGPSVASGYWGRPEETAQTFHGYLADGVTGPFLRTGDLGLLQDGELFVVGRLKDLIIVNGQNHHPFDIEQTALQSHPGLASGTCAAFSIDEDGEERLVLLLEADRHTPPAELEAWRTAIRAAVADRHDLRVHALLFLRTGGLPRTSSGKIQRFACRSGFLAGAFAAIGEE